MRSASSEDLPRSDGDCLRMDEMGPCLFGMDQGGIRGLPTGFRNPQQYGFIVFRQSQIKVTVCYDGYCDFFETLLKITLEVTVHYDGYCDFSAI